MIINQKILKKAILCDDNLHFTPSQRQVDLICTWFPELSTEDKNLKKGWINNLKNKEITKDQYDKLETAKLQNINSSKTKILKDCWKQVDSAIKLCKINNNQAPSYIPYSFLRKIFSLKDVKIVDIQISKNGDTAILFNCPLFKPTKDAPGNKLFQAEFREEKDLSTNELTHVIYLWTSATEKINCTGKDIKLCIERYIANGKFNNLKVQSLKISKLHKLEIQKKWRPRYTRIEKIYIGRSGKKIQPSIVLVNGKRKPIAVMIPGDNCKACLDLSKEYANELQINYAFSTDLKTYLFYDYTKNILIEEPFEKLPPSTWIQNWDSAYKYKQKKQENKSYRSLKTWDISTFLTKLEKKNKGRAEHNLPPLTLKEYMKSLGIKEDL